MAANKNGRGSIPCRITLSRFAVGRQPPPSRDAAPAPVVIMVVVIVMNDGNCTKPTLYQRKHSIKFVWEIPDYREDSRNERARQGLLSKLTFMPGVLPGITTFHVIFCPEYAESSATPRDHEELPVARYPPSDP
jgi:hypothetical protein